MILQLGPFTAKDVGIFAGTTGAGEIARIMTGAEFIGSDGQTLVASAGTGIVPHGFVSFGFITEATIVISPVPVTTTGSLTA